MKVVIERVGLGSLSRMGCVLGLMAAGLPSLVCGLLALGVVRPLLDWLAGWRDLSISLMGQELVRFDLLQFLGLDNAVIWLQSVAEASLAVFVLTVLAGALLSGALLALLVVLLGFTYNLLASATGGLVVEMAALPGPDERRSVFMAPARPGVCWPSGLPANRRLPRGRHRKPARKA